MGRRLLINSSGAVLTSNSKALYTKDSLQAVTTWTGTQEQYDALTTKSATTLYLIQGSGNTYIRAYYGVKPLCFFPGNQQTVTGYTTLTFYSEDGGKIVALVREGKVEQRNIPHGWTQVEYISSDGTSYIDLDTGIDQDDEIEVVFRLTQSGQTSRQIFGYRASASQNNCTVFIGGSGNIVVDFNNSDYSPYRAIATNAYTQNTVYRAVISKSRRALYAGDALVVENTTACPDTITIPDVYAMKVGGSPTSNNCIIGDLISVTIKGKVNGIPAKQDSDSVYGIYDAVADYFLTDASEGSFTGGSAAVPTPATPMDLWCNNGKLAYARQLTLDSTRYYAYISTNNTWSYSLDSYSIVIPVTVGKKYCIQADPTTPIDGVVNVIFRWGFVDTIYDNWAQTVSVPSTLSVTIYDYVRSTPQDTQFVEVTATHPYMVLQMGAAIFASNIANGRITVKELGLYCEGTAESISLNSDTASVASLFAVGDYKDTHDVISGAIGRKVGVYVCTGAADEAWSRTDQRASLSIIGAASGASDWSPLCTHYAGYSGTASLTNMTDNSCKFTSGSNALLVKDTEHNTDLAVWKAYLAAQYAAGTPVIVIYPLATPTTESATAQEMNEVVGSNTVEITANVSDPKMTITYID